ncbi:MAG: hypothetical protein AAB067_00330 [Planctomycetota bacterium]
MIRTDKIYTLNKSIVIKIFGRIKTHIHLKIKESFLEIIEQHNTVN